MKTPTRCILPLLVFDFVLLWCDSSHSASSPDEPEVLSDPLTFDVFQRLTAESPLVQVGQAKVPFANPIDLAHLPRLKVSFEVDSYGVRVFSEEGGDKDLAVFFIFRDLKADSFGFVRRARIQVSSVGPPATSKTEPMTLAGQAGFDGVVYGFFIEGIGDPPAQPVTVRITPEDQVYDLVIDPVANMLPLHYVLHLTTDDLDLLDQADDYLRIESKNPFANDSTAFMPLLVFNGIVPIRGDDKVYWFETSPLGPTSSASWGGIRLIDDLHLYAFMFAGW